MRNSFSVSIGLMGITFLFLHSFALQKAVARGCGIGGNINNGLNQFDEFGNIFQGGNFGNNIGGVFDPGQVFINDGNNQFGFGNGFNNGFNTGFGGFGNGFNNGFGNGFDNTGFGGLFNSPGAGVFLVDQSGNPIRVLSDGLGNFVDDRGAHFSVPRDQAGNPLDRFGNILTVAFDSSGLPFLVGTDRAGNIVRIPNRDGRIVRPILMGGNRFGNGFENPLGGFSAAGNSNNGGFLSGAENPASSTNTSFRRFGVPEVFPGVRSLRSPGNSSDEPQSHEINLDE